MSTFALLRVEGAPGCLVEGPFPPEKIYNQGLHGQGYRKGGFEGLPRFKKSRFRSGYPYGKVELSDVQIPIEVDILAWSPLIPLDDVNSGIPVAILEYTLRNPSKRRERFGFSYHLSHPALGADGWRGTRNAVIPGRGIFFTNTDPMDAPSFGSGALVGKLNSIPPEINAQIGRMRTVLTTGLLNRISLPIRLSKRL